MTQILVSGAARCTAGERPERQAGRAAEEFHGGVDKAAVPARLEHLEKFEQHRGAEDEDGDDHDVARIGEGEDEADDQQRQGPLELGGQGRDRRSEMGPMVTMTRPRSSSQARIRSKVEVVTRRGAELERWLG